MPELACDEYAQDMDKEPAKSEFCFSEPAGLKAAWQAAMKWWCPDECPPRKTAITLGKPQEPAANRRRSRTRLASTRTGGSGPRHATGRCGSTARKKKTPRSRRRAIHLASKIRLDLL
jgi:hypothetical protein